MTATTPAPVEVTQEDRDALERIDDALGFLMEDERELVLQAFAAHRIAALSARVMGWCEVERPIPGHVPPLMILLGRLSDDQVTAYNQACSEHQPHTPKDKS